MKSLAETIRIAFAFRDYVESIGHDVAREMNREISCYNHDSVIRILPLLMLSEMRRCGVSSLGDTGDHLVYYLDGNVCEVPIGIDDDNENYEFRRRRKRQDLARFTAMQANAVLSWLQEVALPKYGDLCPEDIASAIAFWRRRVTELASE